MRCLGPELTEDYAFQEAYPTESVALGDLDEPGVVPPLSYIVGVNGRIVATVSGYRPGTLLAHALEEFPRGFDLQTAATIVRDVLGGLATLHARGVPHRVVDPAHVVIGVDGHCFLIDTGLARRPYGHEPSGAIADDLAAVPELFRACIGGGRTRHGDAAGELSGAAAAVYEALLCRPAVGLSAGRVTIALDRAAADNFDADWDGRGRERLTSIAARSDRSEQRGVLEVIPVQRGAETVPLAAAAVARVRHRGEAVPVYLRRAWVRVRPAPPQFKRGSHAAGGSSGGLLKYLLPLAIIAVAFAPLLVVVLVGHSSAAPHGVTTVPSHKAPPATYRIQPVATPRPTAPATTPPPSTSAWTPPPITTIPPPASPTVPPTGLTAVTITSFGYQNPFSGMASVVIHITTTGPAPVNVAVTVDQPGGGFGGGPGGPGGPGGSSGGGSHTDHFTESGSTQYTVTDNVNVPPSNCWYGVPMVVATAHVTATVPSTPGATESTSGNMWSSC